MKLILAAVLTLIAASAPANQVEMMLVPRESAEGLVKDNLRLQGEVEALRDAYEKLRKHRDTLQSATNCA